MPRIAEVLMKLKLSFQRGDEEGEKQVFRKFILSFFADVD
jgi:hypothetical protein